MSLSARFNGEFWENIRGVDPKLDKMDEPTKDPNAQGGKRVDASFSLNLHPTTRFFYGKQFFAEINKPIVQSLDGPQLQKRSAIKIGFQWEL